jgi:hypothetical protein
MLNDDVQIRLPATHVLPNDVQIRLSATLDLLTHLLLYKNVSDLYPEATWAVKCNLPSMDVLVCTRRRPRARHLSQVRYSVGLHGDLQPEHTDEVPT